MSSNPESAGEEIYNQGHLLPLGQRCERGRTNMITKPAQANLSVPCNKCGQPVPIKNGMAAKLIRAKGITCKDCLSPTETSASHGEYINSEHWKAFRAYAFTHYERKCYLCNTHQEPIELHHNTYERKGREKLSDVIPLCRKHHQLYEDNKG